LKSYRLYLVTAAGTSQLLSEHASREAAVAAGRRYCRTDVVSGARLQHVRVEGPGGFVESWHKGPRPLLDSAGFMLRYERFTEAA
jgi:hypothetical protein